MQDNDITKRTKLDALRDSTLRLKDNQHKLRRRYYEIVGFYPLDSEIFDEGDIIEGELVVKPLGLLQEQAGAGGGD
jgi:hypothetical protein